MKMAEKKSEPEQVTISKKKYDELIKKEKIYNEILFALPGNSFKSIVDQNDCGFCDAAQISIKSGCQINFLYVDCEKLTDCDLCTTHICDKCSDLHLSEWIRSKEKDLPFEFQSVYKICSICSDKKCDDKNWEKFN